MNVLKKEAKSEYNNLVLLFINNLVQISLNMKIVKLEERDNYLRKSLNKMNSLIENERKKCKFSDNCFQSKLYEGILFPFNDFSESNQVLINNF